jgi:hypothetical protein
MENETVSEKNRRHTASATAKRFSSTSIIWFRIARLNFRIVRNRPCSYARFLQWSPWVVKSARRRADAKAESSFRILSPVRLAITSGPAPSFIRHLPRAVVHVPRAILHLTDRLAHTLFRSPDHRLVSLFA